MFCGECGNKLKKGDLFCEKCGAKTNQISEPKKEVDISQKNMTKKPMSRKNKIIILLVLFVVLILGGTYKILSDKTNPKAVANEYISAIIKKDAKKLYSYLQISGDTTFITRDVFANLVEENESNIFSEIENYKITDVTYGSGKLSATVTFKYTADNSSTENNGVINLIKAKGKKYVFFNNWKLADFSTSNTIAQNFVIKVPKGSEVTYAGIKLTDTYLDTKLSTSKLDAYMLPQVFIIDTKVEVKLANGMTLEKYVSPESNNDEVTITIDKYSLSNNDTDQITTIAKTVFSNIYKGVIGNKSFAEIKTNIDCFGDDTSNIETAYNELVTDLTNSYYKLTDIDFTDAFLYELEIDSNGNIVAEISLDYDYTVEYKSWSDSITTHSDNDYSYMDLTFSYVDGKYCVIGISYLEDYFSIY